MFVTMLKSLVLRPVSVLRDGAVAWVAGPQIPEPRGRFAVAVADVLGTRLGRGGSRRWP